MEAKLITQILGQTDRFSSGKCVFVGLDGYVDKIQHPVEFADFSVTRFHPTLTSFSERVGAAAGQSAQIELSTQQIKAGGNAPIMANALANAGINNICLGTVGYPEIDVVFHDVHENCKLISVGKPAETNALEFNDGKLILSELSTFKNLDWQAICLKVSLKALISEVSKSDLVAIVGVCNLPHAVNIWRGFLEDVIKPGKNSRRDFLFDLADPTKNSDETLLELLVLINAYGEFGQVTLGLNENETLKLYKAMFRARERKPEHQISLTEAGQYIYNELDIDQLMVHPVDRCILFSRSGNFMLKGRVIDQPKVSTGGGDNFNAGFCVGRLNGFCLEESMILAMATSGSYVHHGKSPDRQALIDYMAEWRELLKGEE